jgi:hypothetical protein
MEDYFEACARSRPLPLEEVPIVQVNVAGDQIHVVGSDSDGFIHIWFKLNGSSIEGTWIGRNFSDNLHGKRVGSRPDGAL